MPFRYVFVGLDSAVNVYSVSTSRLLHALRIGITGRVVGYKLCPINPDYIYVFTSSGRITKWEWTSGKRLCSWEMRCKTITANLTCDETEDGHAVSFFCVQEQKNGKRQVSIVRVADKGLSQNAILDTSKKISGLKVSQRGQAIFTWDSRHIFIATRNVGHHNTSNSPVQYTWTEVRSPVDITCLDIRESVNSARPGAQSSKRRNHKTIDLALGGVGGSVLVLYDALNCLPNVKEGHQNGELSAFRKFHWHRDPVRAVQWSRDGTYASKNNSL